jgi:hypothetical protein
MPQWPHEYVVHNWHPDKELVFEGFVVLIRAHGLDAPFLDGTTYRNLEIGAWCRNRASHQTRIVIIGESTRRESVQRTSALAC